MAITADELVRRNTRFVADGAFVGLPFPSNQTLRVIGCVDSRVDPSHVLAGTEAPILGQPAETPQPRVTFRGRDPRRRHRQGGFTFVGRQAQQLRESHT